MSNFMDKLDTAFEEQRSRSEDWLSDTHIRKDAPPPRDVFAQEEPEAPPAAEPAGADPAWARAEALAADADESEVEWLLGENEYLAQLGPASRLETARRFDISQRLWLEERYEDALEVALGGGHPELIAAMLREDDEDTFDEVINELAERAGQEAFEAGAEALKAGIESNKDLQSAEGAQLLAGLLAGGETFDADQMQALVEAAGRGARQQRVEAENNALLAAFDEGVRQSPYSAGTEDDNVRDIWAPPSPSREEREVDEEYASLGRLGAAMLMGKQPTAAEQVAKDWEATIGAQEAQAEEWAAVQQRAHNLGQEAARKRAEGGR